MTTTTLHTTPAPSPVSGFDGGPSVEVMELSKRYGSAAAVDGVSFDVPKGQVTGLLGPNGAGKTTLMKILLGLVEPSEGRATVLGVDRSDREFVQAIRRVGALVEEPALYRRLSGRQNLEVQALALGIDDRKSRIGEVLELVDLADRADDRACTYSLGMKQRLGIAVAMIGRPELMILDEPANGLDPAGIVEIRALLRRLPEMGATVLVSSHQLAEVQQACDRLVVLDRGRLVVSGTTSEILMAHTTSTYMVRVDPGDVGSVVEHLRLRSLSIGSVGEDSLTVALPDGWSGGDINRTLAGIGIHPHELTHQAPNLETAFLTMTGAHK